MKIKHVHLFAAVLVAGAMLTSCHSDIDLNDIDTTAELEMGLVVPIGSMHATVGDFLGNGQVQNLYFEIIDNSPVLTWRDTFSMEKDFHADSLDLAKKVSDKDLSLNVYDKVSAMIGPDGKVTGNGMPITLRFEMPVKMKGINNGNERIDSAQIVDASFKSIIQTHNLPLEWEWIDRVTLDLGDQVIRPAGNIMTVYSKGDEGGYGQEIPTSVDHFTINLMKDKTAAPADNNVVDECMFYVNFTFTIPNGTKVDVPNDAAFDYHLAVQFIDYKAVWGKFLHSTDMYDEGEFNIAEELGDMDFITKWCLPFDDPRIDLFVSTRLAGSIMIHGNYLYSEDANGQKHYATFLRQGQEKQDDYTPLYPGDYLDPVTSQPGDSAVYLIYYNKTPERGHIDRLFGDMPQKIGYKFDVDFNYSISPQIRLVPNTKVHIDAVATLPFIFRNGLFLNYTDTVDADMSNVDIDSLVHEVDVVDTLKATDLKLLIKAQNTIPMDIKATMRCLDAAGNVIMDPDDPTKPFQITEEDPIMKDTILIKAPTFHQTYGTWTPEGPGESLIIASINKKKAQMLKQVRKIVYYAQIDESSLQSYYQQGMSNVRVYDNSGLRIRLGLTTRLDAIFNFDKKNNNH